MRYIWDTPLSKIITSLTAMFAFIVGAAGAWDALGDYKPATRGWVLAESKTTRSIAQDIQIEQAEGKLEATEEALAKWKAEVVKAQDQAIINLSNQRIRELVNQKSKLEEQVRSLKAKRAN